MNFRIDYEPTTSKRQGRKRKGKINIIGKIVAITGSLPGMTRAQAEYWVKTRKKAVYSYKVDKRVSYLIQGKAKGKKKTAKVKAAEKCKVPIIAFEEIA